MRRFPLRPACVRVLSLCLLLIPQLAFAAPAKLSSVSISPGSVIGGQQPTCTVTLTAGAPHGGANVTLTSSNTAVVGSTSVLVPQGQTTASTGLATLGVAAATTVTVTGSYNATATANLTVTPASVSALTLTPDHVTGAIGSSTARVYLNGYAPPAGATVAVSSSSAYAPVPASLTVPGNSTLGQFTISPAQVPGTTYATITATLGTAASATLQIDPCIMGVPAGPPTNPLDVVFWNGYNSLLTSGYNDIRFSATGTYSVTNGAASGPHDATFISAHGMLLTSGQKVVVDLLPNLCSPPREIVLGWHTTGGVWKKAYYGSALIGGEASMLNLGSIPGSTAWTRVEIAASTLGLTGAIADGFTLQTYDGQAWVDHGAQLCPEVTVAAPTMPSGDTIWVDDAAPAGATVSGVFSTAQHALGAKALFAPQYQSNYTLPVVAITNATDQLPVYIGESLFVYTLPSTCSTPTEILVKWHSSSGDQCAYWGTSHNLPCEAHYRGAIPSGPGWVRLEVPASTLGLEERTISGVEVWMADGAAWVDAIGKSGTACHIATQPAPAMPPGDTIWIDDSAWAEGLGSWTTSQHALGIQSITETNFDASIGGAFNVLGPSNLPIFIGEKMLVYVLLDPCAIPNEILFTWGDRQLHPRGAYWGAGGNKFGEVSNGWVDMGALPPAGQWVRLEVPASLLRIEDSTIPEMRVMYDGGRMWVDAMGKTGVPCTPPRASQPVVPAGDEVWVDDGASPYMDVGMAIDSSQSATGNDSYTTYNRAADGTKQIDFFNLNKPIGYGDKLVFYYLNNMTCNPSGRLSAFWTGGGNGNLSVALGTCNTGEICLGAIDTTGAWTRVEVPASLVGLEGYSVSMAVFKFTGGLWFDHIGVQHCVMPAPGAVQPPASDNVWIDDDVPAGAATNAVWAMDQTASGTRSIGGPAAGPGRSFTTSNVSFAVNPGDTLVFYALGSTCKPPSNVVVGVTTTDGVNMRAYWGAPSSGEPSSSLNMGALPAAGQWVRYEVPASALGIEGKIVNSITNEYAGGIVWIDRVGSAPAP